MYYLNGISSSCNNATSIIEWHRILGHCNFGDVRKLEKVVRGTKITDYREVDCEVCTQGKMCQTRSREPDQSTKAPLDFVHCDLAGPIEPAAKDGFKYALCFIDDFTGINMIYFLKQKSDTFEATEKFLADVAPYGKVKRLWSDSGGEFSSQKFKTLLRVSMQSDTKQAHLTLLTKTVLLKGHGEAYLIWLDVYYRMLNYPK